MATALAHRGPDSQGIYVSPDCRVMLAHRRLSILDLTEAGHQPMIAPAGNGALTFNGEIFNHRELRRQLSHYGFRSRCDSEALLALMAEGLPPGDACARLDGMFAFAYYDSTSGRLTLGRDHFGIKPLYYCRLPEAVIFASEPRALFATGLVEADLCPEGFVNLACARMEAAGPTTWFRGVEQIEPACWAQIDTGGMRFGQYWDPSEASEREIDHEDVTQAFVDALSRRHEADVPRGAMLSGGVDSSAVVTGLCRLGARPRAFIAKYVGEEESQNRDLPYARLVSNGLGIHPEEVEIDLDDFGSLIDGITQSTGRPSLHGVELAMARIYERIAATSVRVVYSGHGADEMWGYQDGEYFPFLSPQFPLSNHGRHHLCDDYLANENPAWRRFILERLAPHLGVPKKVVCEMTWERTLRYYKACRSLNVVKRARFHLLRTFLVYVNQMVDALSMRVSLEDRPVFQDVRLAELSFALSEDRKNSNGPTGVKPFLKAALAEFLPPEVINRPKVGFQPPRSVGYQNAALELLDDHLPFGLPRPPASAGPQPFDQTLFLVTTQSWLRTFSVTTLKIF